MLDNPPFPITESLFLASVEFVCAVMVVVNLLLVRRRGSSGYLMACAFLALGATLFAYQRNAPQAVLVAGTVLVAAFLGADFFYRTSKTK